MTHCSSMITKSGQALVSRMSGGIVGGGCLPLRVGRSANSFVCDGEL